MWLGNRTAAIVVFNRGSDRFLRAETTSLEAAFKRGSLVVAAPVFAELIAAPVVMRASSAPSSKIPESQLIGSWENRYGDLPGERFNPTLSDVRSNVIQARGAFWLTS